MTDTKNATIYKKFEDGYVVRRMTPADAKIVEGWFNQIAAISSYDLDIALSVYPQNSHGFYIGEYEREAVASAIRIPWNNIFYGSLYYVVKKYRSKGFGTRLRDQVAREHVGDNILCIDSVLGAVAEKNLAKFGYKNGFKTGRYSTTAKKHIASYSGELRRATEVPFDDLISYDNKNFITPDNRERREFLKQWIRVPKGASFVAIDASGQIIGFGCRRPCLEEKQHIVGPLYADNLKIAGGILQRLLDDIEGEEGIVHICHTNPDALKMIEQFGCQEAFGLQRMYLNGDPGTPKNTVFATTSIDVCSF